ncbi:MAG: hypothetical protein H0V03_02295 [Thermoleophilaceae bacterium]|nr:hypothetical protein [Thermoleophilaceae bacterium]
MRVVRQPESGSSEDGSVTTRQCAELTLPRAELERVWKPENLERLAATYWRYLGQISLGLLRVVYTPSSRELVVLGRPFVLLSFEAPRYELGDYDASVTYELSGGLLVAPAQRAGQGHLRISVRRPKRATGDEVTLTVVSQVANFYPLIAGWGWWSRVGRLLYRLTQLRVHVLVTHGFMRSLANLDLAPTHVGALGAPAGEATQASPRRARTALSPPAHR